MAYESLLFQAQPQSIGAPILVKSKNATADGVNIHKDYCWTLSTNNAREYVPKLMLTEYKLVLSSEVAGFLYTIRGEADNLNVIKRSIVPIVSNAAGNAVDTTKAAIEDISKLFSNSYEAVQKEKGVNSSPTTGAKPNNETIQDAQNNSITNIVDGLDVYKGLYALEPTNWTYVMPYLGNANMLNPNNTWGEGTQMKEAIGDIMGGAGTLFSEFGKAAQATGAPAAPLNQGGGASIFSVLRGAFQAAKGARSALLGAGGGLVMRETPQSFTNTGSDSLECSFYLINTSQVTDIRRNWEFCYLFTYQNLANRKGINLLDPPCLYRALIPGYKQLPICWITNLNITNVGSTKMLVITTGEPASSKSDPSNVKMVPEAYKVTFNLESALKNARNLFQFAADPSGVVTVSFKGQTPA